MKPNIKLVAIDRESLSVVIKPYKNPYKNLENYYLNKNGYYERYLGGNGPIIMSIDINRLQQTIDSCEDSVDLFYFNVIKKHLRKQKIKKILE